MSQFEINPSSLKGTAFARELSEESEDLDRLSYIEIALLLELAVKHGLVSPPVWIVERNHDKNISFGPCFDRQEAERIIRDLHPSHYTAKVWKGQSDE